MALKKTVNLDDFVLPIPYKEPFDIIVQERRILEQMFKMDILIEGESTLQKLRGKFCWWIYRMILGRIWISDKLKIKILLYSIPKEEDEKKMKKTFQKLRKHNIKKMKNYSHY